MNIREKRGITLIALVITIVVLIILAGVTIATLTSDNGIMSQATKAKGETEDAEAEEKLKTAILASYDEDGKINLSKLKEEVEKYQGTVNSADESFPVVAIINGYEFNVSDTGSITEYEDSVTASDKTTHSSKSIEYDWENLSIIAEMISNNTNITYETVEVIVTLNGEKNTLGVGDYIYVDGKKVRILGFNHDDLTDSTAYGETTSTGKAGISFEYVDFLTSSSMSNTNTNENGWGECALRTKLNGTLYDALNTNLKNVIKEVNKEYIKTYTDASSKEFSNDKLWLLSCGEIWDNGYNGGETRGQAIATEGKQYAYYKLNLKSVKYDESTDVVQKPDTENAEFWWLRSPYYAESIRYCGIWSDGGVAGYAWVGGVQYVAPGFAI